MDRKVYRPGGGGGGSERNVDEKVTVAKSIKSSKSLQIKIIDFVDTRTLANCKKISCTGYDKLCIPPGLSPSAVVTAVKDIVETFLTVRPQRKIHRTIFIN